MYLTINETAKLLKVSTKTVYRKVKSGAFPHVRIGDKAIRIDSDALGAALDKAAQKGVL
jgi:excisionase family DNA binding protein